jgi:integrase
VRENGIVAPTAKDFAEYIIWLKSRSKPATVNLYLIVVRKFFRFLGAQHIYADLSQKVKIKFEKVDPMRRNTVGDEDVKKLLDAVSQESGQKGDRDKLIILTALYSGLRVSEIASLRKEDIINDAGVYKLMPLRKGHRQRSVSNSVFICAELYDTLQNYIQKYKIENYIFCDWRYVDQRPLQGGTVSGVIGYYLRKAGIKREDVTPHSLRHWFLTKYYQMSKDIFLTQRQAGHSSIDSTMVYMHPSLRRDTPVLEMRRSENGEANPTSERNRQEPLRAGAVGEGTIA